jgi:hypothetical protein
MHLRLSTVRRGDKTYRYAQLVESYRREEDGRPTHRVVASLGALSDEAIANLRTALDANRRGEPLVLPRSAPATGSKPLVLANYRYLDVAVLLRLWRDTGLAALLADLLGGSGDVGADQVVVSLVAHRCVDPGSKLAATRWFPTTALPELLGVRPEQFNNSRVHRALEALEQVEGVLQARLPHVVRRVHGASVRLFIDATDTWFVGAGPPLAAKGKDKQGLYRRRIGIVLLCDERGFPLRWETLDGGYHDPTALLEMAVQASKLDWVGETPIVLDRAAGNAAAVETLAGTGMRFLTALPSTEFVSSRAPIPWDAVATLQAACEQNGATAETIANAARAAGFDGVRGDRFVLDLHVFDKARSQESEPTTSAAQIAMRFALACKHAPQEAASLAEEHGLAQRTARRYRELLTLRQDLQLRVLAGEADAVALGDLRAVAAAPEEEQLAAFEAAITLSGTRTRTARVGAPDTAPLRTRGVLCFSPRRFLEKRQGDAENLRRVEEDVAALNRRLADARNRRTDASALAAAHQRIVRVGLGGVLSPRLEKRDGRRLLVLDRDEAAWARRRRVDGLGVIVGHPDLTGTAADLVALYFAKDAVEKDFQTIKSAIELRPVHHRTDAKLRAHVTVCMLALLLQRVLRERLKSRAPKTSAAAALEILGRTHLNRVNGGKARFHTVTVLDEAQQSLLAALGMEDLARDDWVATNITPR